MYNLTVKYETSTSNRLYSHGIFNTNFALDVFFIKFLNWTFKA